MDTAFCMGVRYLSVPCASMLPCCFGVVVAQYYNAEYTRLFLLMRRAYLKISANHLVKALLCIGVAYEVLDACIKKGFGPAMV